MTSTILLVFSFVCFTLAAFNAPSGPINLIGAGGAFAIASMLFH